MFSFRMSIVLFHARAGSSTFLKFALGFRLCLAHVRINRSVSNSLCWTICFSPVMRAIPRVISFGHVSELLMFDRCCVSSLCEVHVGRKSIMPMLIEVVIQCCWRFRLAFSVVDPLVIDCSIGPFSFVLINL